RVPRFCARICGFRRGGLRALLLRRAGLVEPPPGRLRGRVRSDPHPRRPGGGGGRSLVAGRGRGAGAGGNRGVPALRGRKGLIRSAWVGLILALATWFFGLVVIIASLLRVRGRIYFWATQQWSRAVLRASRVPVRSHGIERVDWSQAQVL